jgi:cardiolipin synthase
MVALFYWDSPENRWLLLCVFIAAGVTDFLDGYLARRNNNISLLGRFLDPVADKLLVAALILMLVGFDRMTSISYVPATIILLRELFVSGLREFLATTEINVPVTMMAKWKTTIQMLALGFLIIGDGAPLWIHAKTVGEVGLWVAAALTMITGYKYWKFARVHIIE